MTTRFMLTALFAFLLVVPTEARTLTVTESNDGKTVTLHSGDHLRLRLTSNPTTGYSWNFVTPPHAPLTLTGQHYISSQKPGMPIKAGAGGTEEFLFRARTQKAQQVTLQMRYVGPGGSHRIAYTFRLTIQVRPSH